MPHAENVKNVQLMRHDGAILEPSVKIRNFAHFIPTAAFQPDLPQELPPQRLSMPSDLHTPERVLRAANLMADAAGEVILPYFRQAPEVANKIPQNSAEALPGQAFDPVTEADRSAERAIREVISQHFPEDGILGEEYGEFSGSSGYYWVLDPIDGTRAFITGVPQWGTLIALHNGERAEFGMMNQPFLGERYIGSIDGASWFVNGEPRGKLSTRRCAGLDSAILMTTCPDLFQGASATAFEKIRQSVAMTRYGGDCYSYCMLAAGHSDLVIETGLNAYDIQALIPIVEAAGGIVTNWQGGPLVAGGDAIAAGDPRCHSAALAFFQHLA